MDNERRHQGEETTPELTAQAMPLDLANEVVYGGLNSDDNCLGSTEEKTASANLGKDGRGARYSVSKSDEEILSDDGGFNSKGKRFDVRASGAENDQTEPQEQPRRGLFTEKWQLAIRVGIIAIGIVCATFFATCTYNVKKGDGWYPLKGAIQDRGHDMMTPVHDWFLLPEHKPLLHATMIICALMMDTLVLSILLYFAFFGKSWRILLEFFAFYSLRFTCQFIFSMQLPAGIYWEYPGFFSISVPYGYTNDFFYSGHIGACVMCFLEYRDISNLRPGQTVRTWGQKLAKNMQRLAVVSFFCQIFILLTTRGHYSIDMIAGGIIAHYMHIMVGFYVKPFDKKFMGVESEADAEAEAELDAEEDFAMKGAFSDKARDGEGDWASDGIAAEKARAKSDFFAQKNNPASLEMAERYSEP